MLPQLHVTDKDDLINSIAPVRNEMFIKPRGGFWTSTYNKEYGSEWIDWCKENEFSTSSTFNGFILYIKEGVRVYKVDSEQDLMKLFSMYELRTELPIKALDFEKISKDYDGLHLTSRGQVETRLTYPYNLYGWDCECTLWFNWCFTNIEKYDHKLKV